MASLVSSLQKDILDSKKNVTEVLRTAKLISAKLGLSDITAFIEAEMNGYAAGALAPPYRVIRGGSLQFYNPYHGWLPVGDVGNHATPIGQPITELEELSKAKTVVIPVHEKFKLSPLGGGSDAFAQQFEQRIVLSAVKLKAILEAVIDEILNWAIELEQKGITGEDMSFDKEEKQKAQSQTFNIQHFTGVLGDVKNSNLRVYDYSSIHQLLRQNNVPQDERNEFENILDELRTATDPTKKTTLIERGKAWIVKNEALLGTGVTL